MATIVKFARKTGASYQARIKLEGQVVRPQTFRTKAASEWARAYEAQLAERPRHHAYLFANQRATRIKVLVHGGFGLSLCARRRHQGS